MLSTPSGTTPWVGFVHKDEASTSSLSQTHGSIVKVYGINHPIHTNHSRLLTVVCIYIFILKEIDWINLLVALLKNRSVSKIELKHRVWPILAHEHNTNLALFIRNENMKTNLTRTHNANSQVIVSAHTVFGQLVMSCQSFAPMEHFPCCQLHWWMPK